MEQVKTMTGTSDPSQTKKFFELFRANYDLADLPEGPMRGSYREHVEAGQQLADFMLKFTDMGAMDWWEFEQPVEVARFLDEQGLRIERALMALSGSLANIYQGEELVGYCHMSADTFVLGVKAV